MRLRLQLILALCVALFAGPAFAQEGLDLLGVDNGAVVGAAPPSGPLALANATTGSTSGTTYSSLSSVSCPAGAVAEAAVLGQSSFASSFKDSVDPSTAWTQVAAGGPSFMDIRLFQRIVPAGGFNSSTTYTVVFGGTSSSSAMVAACFPGATSAPTANDGNNDGNGVGTLTTTVTGPTSATSWQFAAVGSSWATGTPGPAGGSDPSWTPMANNVNGNTWGISAYYRQAASTSSTQLNVDAGGTALMSAVWGEAKP